MKGRIDLNADVGEGAGDDAALIPAISSANVACGVHAGDPQTMRATVEIAARHGVAVGAHPGFDDPASFGRRELPVSPADVEDLVAYQIGALAAMARAQGLSLRHVKAHGALYNMAARDAALADAIARAVAAVDPALVLFGLSGSQLIAAGKRAGLRTASEVFADRAYQSDGTLVPRSVPGAVIDAPDVVVARAIEMAARGAVTSIDGARVPLEADTICVHGDTPHAAALAQQIRNALTRTGIKVKAPWEAI